MKAFNHFLNTARQMLPWIQNSRNLDDFTIRRCEDKISFDINSSDEIMTKVAEHGQLHLMQTYVLFEMIRKGPKALNLPERYIAPLLNTDLNLGIADYNQPFDFMCVNLPTDFINKYTAEYEDDALGNGPGKHSPECVMVCHNQEAQVLILHVTFTSNQAITAMLNNNEDIEQQINATLQATLTGSASIDESETIAAGAAAKIALNAMLLAENNLRGIGPYNESYYNRLKKQSQNKHTTDAQKRTNEIELATHPFIYEIDQNVQTYNKSDGSEHGGTRGGNKPHWRRGHYRLQRHGKGLEFQKRLRIPPVLVNSHLFLGNNIDSKVTYELNTPIQETSAAP
jgi:hypothetical protein